MIRNIFFLLLTMLVTIPVHAQYPNNSTTSELQVLESMRKTDQQSALSRNNKPSHFLASGETKQKLDSIIEYNFNEETDEWDQKFRKTSYAYNNTFNDTLYLLAGWNDETNQWENLWKETSTFNEHGNITGYEAYTQGISQQMAPMYKGEYTYNNNQQLIESLDYYWKYTLQDWALVGKTLHHYDSNGSLLTDTVYNKYNGSDEWVLSQKVKYDYNNRYLELMETFEWDSDSAKWQTNEKKEMLYDSEEGYLYGYKTHIWADTINDWIIKEVERYGHDEENNMYTSATITWNPDTTVLMKKYDFDYTVENDKLILPFILDPYDNMAFHHKIIHKELKQFNRQTNGREKYREVEYYYSPVESSTGTDINFQDMVMVYPNPVKESIQINFPSTYDQALLELYNISGQKIFSTVIKNGAKTDISSLTNGIYLYNIYLGKKKVTGKLIKE